MIKNEVKKMIDNLPDDCTLEEIQYTLYVQSKLLKAMDDVDHGRTLDAEEMNKRFSSMEAIMISAPFQFMIHDVQGIEKK